jgi:hypothetical protein
MCVVCVTVAGTVVVASQITPIEVLSDFTSTQRTLSSFSSTTTLPNKQRVEVRALLDKSPDANAVVCAGLTLRGATRSVIAAASNRARAACNFAKTLRPNLVVTIANKTTSIRSNAGRVNLEVRTPRQQESAPGSTTPPGFVETGTLQDLTVCRIADARINKTQPNNVGFPLRRDLIPSSGVANFIVIPVDFSDQPASGDPGSYLLEQTGKMREWYEFFSKKKMSLEFQIGTSWVRAPKPDSAYQVPKSVPNSQGVALETQRMLMQDIINVAGNSFDYSKAHGIFLYFPTVKSVDYDMGGRGTMLNTPSGQKQFFFWGGGAYHFDSRNVSSAQKREKMWAFWIHEILHSQDQALHGPGNGFHTGLGQDQYGTSLVLSTWELFRFGWLDEQNIACIDANAGLGQSIQLRPLESGAANLRAAMVKISEFEILVFESRRPEGYSAGWTSSEKGVFAYIIDTRLDSDRSGESTGADTGNDTRFQRWSYYLAPDGKDLSYVRGRLATRYLMQPGDTLTYKNVRISLESSGQTDNIRITQP